MDVDYDPSKNPTRMVMQYPTVGVDMQPLPPKRTEVRTHVCTHAHTRVHVHILHARMRTHTYVRAEFKRLKYC